MAYDIKIKVTELDKQIKQMNEHYNLLEQQINKLYQDCLPPLQNGWKGKDNLAYISQLNGYLEKLEKLKEDIRKYIIVLEIASKKYRSVTNNAKNVVVSGR